MTGPAERLAAALSADLADDGPVAVMANDLRSVLARLDWSMHNMPSDRFSTRRTPL